MKKTLFSAFICLTFFVSATAQPLADADRSFALNHLKKTKKEILKIVKGLSSEQLNYKPDADTWSIAECLEHIVASEQQLSGAFQMILGQDPDPTKRSAVKMTDEQLVALITDRSTKVKTRPDLEPKGHSGAFEDTLAAFKEVRGGNLRLLKTTNEDLRNRYFEFPFGQVDALQVLLFISAHSQRHAQQMSELVALQSFPG